MPVFVLLLLLLFCVSMVGSVEFTRKSPGLTNCKMLLALLLLDKIQKQTGRFCTQKNHTYDSIHIHMFVYTPKVEKHFSALYTQNA